MKVLTINAGSSSIRLAVLEESPGGLRRVAALHRHHPPEDIATTLREFLAGPGAAPVDLVAHRVVHGGEKLVDACRIDAGVEAEIARLAPLAPLHNPASLAWIRACRAIVGPDRPQLAVFDTAFFADLPAVARHYALPRELSAGLHLRRFGFHGLAHQGMLQRWRQLAPDAGTAARVISLQLGAGCSITASRGGAPVDTSMGFSPLEGLVMATRSGDVDPGLLLHLQRTQSMTPDSLERLLNTGSGLLGLSGISGDMRTLLASDAPEARLAVELYCYRARKYLGAYLAVLGGVDAVLFGGGVGENAPTVREQVLGGLQWAGIHLDRAANDRAVGVEACIGTTPVHGGAAIWTLPVDESLLLARQALQACRLAREEPPHE
jgi:acetate kinase